MHSEYGLKTTLAALKAFEALPVTEEKISIQKRFIDDEIGHLEYLDLAYDYTERLHRNSLEKENNNDQ